MTDFPKRTAAFDKFCDFLIKETDLKTGLRIAVAADEVIRIAAVEAFDIASNGWDRINCPGRLTSGRHLISPVIVWLFAVYGAVEFVANVVIPFVRVMVPR